MKFKKFIASMLAIAMCTGTGLSVFSACNTPSDNDANQSGQQSTESETESSVSYLDMQAAGKLSDFKLAKTAKTLNSAPRADFASESNSSEMYSQYRNEDFYINVRLKNPSNFRVLSLTLSFAGRTLTIDRNNFEDGTSFSNIYVKVPAKYNNSKYTEYTITDITYIKNSTIKKVLIKNNDSILIGIKDIRGNNFQSQAFYETADGYGVGSVSEEFFKNGVLTVPSEHNGKPVTEIGGYAFAYVDAEELIIPDSVNIISEGAFYNCKSLKKVTLGSGIRYIGYKAFYGCNNIDFVDYTGKIASWLNIQFGNPYNESPDTNNRFSNPVYYARDLHINGELLTEVTIPEECVTIRGCAFMRCISLKKVTLSNSVRRIEYRAFDNCVGLTELDLKNVEYIDYYAFSGCWGLTTLTIPQTVRTILGSGKEKAAFYAVQKLVEIYNLSALPINSGEPGFGDVGLYADNVYDNEQKINVKEDRDGFLWYTKQNDNDYIYLIGYNGSKKNITIPYNYEGHTVVIKDCAFAGNNIIEKVTLEEGFASVPARTFAYCRSLKEVVLPSTIAKLDEKAFYYSTISKLILPDKCKVIGENAFTECENLHLTISAADVSFGNRPFTQTNNLTIDYAGTVNSWLAATEQIDSTGLSGFKNAFYGAYNFSINCLE